MRLYSGTTRSLIEDSTFNRIALKLKDAFFNEFRYQPSVAEVNSWNNSLRAISQVFQTASLLDHGVLLELRLPLTSKRLDCLVTGYDSKKAPNAVIIELKQWSGCKGASGKNEVATFVGGSVRDVLRSEEHTSELQSQSNLVCRLLLEKKSNDDIRASNPPAARSDTPHRRLALPFFDSAAEMTLVRPSAATTLYAAMYNGMP